jgi:hypothetical protein
VCSTNIEARLKEIGKPLEIVRGNCDLTANWPMVRRVEREGHHFELIHIPPAVREVAAGTQTVLHGHTHVPRDDYVEGIRFLNPGCITRPNRGAPASFGWLTLRNSGLYDWSLEMVVKD